MLDIKNSSIKNLPLVSRGKNANVYALNEKYVVKLYSKNYSTALIDYEVKAAQIAYSLGIPTPLIKKTKVENRVGIAIERVEGLTIDETLKRAPWKLFEMAKLLARMQAKIHSCDVSGLVYFNRAKRKQIYSDKKLSKQSKETAIQILDALPDNNSFCHGDFKLNNIIVTSDGAKVIDWSYAVSADPYFDVARTISLLQVDYKKRKFGLTKLCVYFYIKLFIKIYVRYYLQLNNVSSAQMIKTYLALERLTQ